MTPDSAPASQLASAVCAVMADVGSIAKTGKMEGRASYSYASEADVLEALQPAMAKHGLCLLPGKILDWRESEYTTGSGATMHRSGIIRQFILRHTSGEEVVLEQVGVGFDSGDKDACKALTSALKYACRQAFCLPTGDDPDKQGSAEQEHGQRQYSGSPRLTRTGPQGEAKAPAQQGSGYDSPASQQTRNTPQEGTGVYFIKAIYRKTSTRGEYLSLQTAMQSQDGKTIYIGYWHDVDGLLTSLGFHTKEDRYNVNGPLEIEMKLSNSGFWNADYIGRPGQQPAAPAPNDWPQDGDDLGDPIDMNDHPLSPGD